MVLIGIDPYPVEFPLKILKIQNEMVDVDGFSEGPKPFSFGQKLNVCLFQAEFQGHAALRQQSILQTIITWELVKIVCRTVYWFCQGTE